jgi:hypothetical protein
MNNLAKPKKVRIPKNQWQTPGQVTDINSQYITMQGVGFDAIGVSPDGTRQYMKNGQDYYFPTKPVREYPLMQNGGGLFSKSVTCSNCGHSWKGVEGGIDALTCHKCGGMVKMQKGGQSTMDSVRHQANKILQYEQLRGGPGGAPLPQYSNPKYMDMLMEKVYPEVKKIMPNASAMEAGEAMDFVFNAGFDQSTNKITKDPRAFALQEYYRQYDKSKLDADGKWAGRKNIPYSFDQEYNNTIGKLPENQRRILMNKARDWYYKNINNPAPGVPNSNYNDTWYGRIWNTNDYQPFNPNNPNFTPKKEQDGGQRNLWNTNKKAWVDSVNNANVQNIDFVQRFYDQSKGSIQIPGEPGRSTHFMAYDPRSKRVYPEVVNVNGKLQYMPGDAAYNYADDTGQYIKFPTTEQAKWYASSKDTTSGYKMGTNVLKSKLQKGGQKDSTLENVAEVFDPTGISSWDDVYRSYKETGISPQTAIEVLGALPLLGKAGKLTKAGLHLAKYKGVDAFLSKVLPKSAALSNSFKAASITGRTSDAIQAAQQYNQTSMIPFKKGGEMIRRADGSYSPRGLWDNVRANKGSGKKPTKEMLEQEKKIRAIEKAMYGLEVDGGPGPKKKVAQTNPYKEVNSGVADFFRNILPVPDNIAQLAAKQLIGDARMSNSSLDDRQKLLLWDVIQNSKKRTGKSNSGTEYEDYGNLGYGSPEDYGNWFNRGKLGITDLVKNSLNNDGFKLASTIGRGRYWSDEKDPDTIYYTDVYDWNSGEKDYKGTNQYQNLRNYVRSTEDKNLNADKNEKFRMNFKLNKKEIDKIRNEQAMKNQLTMGMDMFAQGGTNNPGFRALPEYVQANILSNMGYGGYYNPIMAAGGEANGGMALGQMSAVVDKMSKLRQFISPEQNLDPWIASKLAVMDDSADAISDYMMYNPEAQQSGEEGLSMEQMMRGGGYVVTRSSDRKGKTHKVTGPDGTVKYFGDSKLGQHPKDPERKAAFYARHKKNLDGNPYFRAFARATWQDGGQIDEMANGGYIDNDGMRQISSTPTWSGNMGYEDGGETLWHANWNDTEPSYESVDPMMEQFNQDVASMPARPVVMNLPANAPAANKKTSASRSKGSSYSVVDFMNSQGMPSDYATRKALAEQMGIKGYRGTAEQNMILISALSQGAKSQGSKAASVSTQSGSADYDMNSSNMLRRGYNAPTNPFMFGQMSQRHAGTLEKPTVNTPGSANTTAAKKVNAANAQDAEEAMTFAKYKAQDPYFFAEESDPGFVKAIDYPFTMLRDLGARTFYDMDPIAVAELLTLGLGSHALRGKTKIEPYYGGQKALPGTATRALPAPAARVPRGPIPGPASGGYIKPRVPGQSPRGFEMPDAGLRSPGYPRFAQGGPVIGDEMEVTPEQLEQLRAQGYQFEII